MTVRPIDANQLYRIEKLLDTDIVKKDKVASELLEQVLYDIQHVPTITPPNEWISAEALREPDEPLKNGRSQEHFEKLRNLISDMSVVEIASHIETDNLSEYLGIWRYHAQKELLSIRQLFFEEAQP